MSKEKSDRLYIRKKLKTEISQVVDNYFLTAHNKAKYPYAVLDIKETDDQNYIPYHLEIEVWDKGDNTTTLETICDDLKSLLDRKRVVEDNYAYIIWFSGCITNIDDDKTIKRRVSIFDIHLYKFD